MPLQPPPAYTSTANPSTNGPNLSARQRRLNLPKLNPHARVSSINPAKSPIDVRRWHEKKRNIAYLSGLSLSLLIIALLLNYLYILPKLRSEHEGSGSDIQNAKMLTGAWNMTTLRLETVSAADSTVIDTCASKESEFTRCVDNKWLEPGAGPNYSFDLTENDDGSFNGLFSEGIFEPTGKSEERLTPSRYGLMSKWINTSGDVEGKLTGEGCHYTRAVLFLVTFENGIPTYKITEKQMVAADGDCMLPQGRRYDACECTFIGTRPKTLKKRW
ncbi:hypothetical protein ABW19_dt0204339 [Dactylella cylindrospora]|nr:hypothetical protein ABW19_dt0204339 [Dactylella cylindrospora]